MWVQIKEKQFNFDQSKLLHDELHLFNLLLSKWNLMLSLSELWLSWAEIFRWYLWTKKEYLQKISVHIMSKNVDSRTWIWKFNYLGQCASWLTSLFNFDNPVDISGTCTAFFSNLQYIFLTVCLTNSNLFYLIYS